MRSALVGGLMILTMSCGPGAGSTDAAVADARAPDLGPVDGGLAVNGCARLVSGTASPGDDLGGDTYETFATGFFDDWCVRCHSVRNTTPASRNLAPLGFNWDDRASVYSHLAQIREQVGVSNAMPFDAPDPSCGERLRLIRWIDANAP